MLARFGAAFANWAERWVPDPFVLALGLTFAALGAGAAWAGSISTAVAGWYGGFSSTPLLAFALQMCLVLVTGHAVAVSPPIQRLVDAAARWPKTTPAAAAFVALIACLTGVVHWGLGAVVAAFVVREIAQCAAADERPMDIPILGAAAYTGLAVWHGGLSGSAPLKAAEATSMTGSDVAAIPITETVFSSLNLLVTGGLVVLFPLACYALAPRNGLVPAPTAHSKPTSEPSTRRSITSSLIGVAVAFVVVWSWANGSLAFDLNSVNLFFLGIALTAHRTVDDFLRAAADGAKSAGAIIVQFPMYFGILGAMKATGLIALISNATVSVASQSTFSLLTFLGAGFVNFFIPSGGGQWALQSDILLSAASDLQVPTGEAVMYFAYGDQWTNLLQPFWALPLLGITGLKARQIAGYTALLAVIMAVWIAATRFVVG